MGALLESYIFYEIKRFDIKGKEYLRTLGKYYIVDIGLRNYLLGFRDMDTGHIIENVVYFELLRQGYDVAIGKVDNREVDFIATNVEGEAVHPGDRVHERTGHPGAGAGPSTDDPGQL